jgi:hypothetical protein
MIRACFALFLYTATAASLAAADEPETTTYRFGGDIYAAGGTVNVTDAGADDVFAAGERVTLQAPATGSAHLAGRVVRSDAAVGADLYAAGFSVEIAGTVAGDATAAGHSVRLGADVAGDLRAFATDVLVLAPVGGAAMFAAEHVRLDAPIAGDVSMAVRSAEFGPQARIDGHLTLYADDDVVVPEHVIPAERVERRALERWERPGAFEVIAYLAGGVVIALIVAVAALAIILAVARDWSKHTCEKAIERPFRSIGLGFVALAMAIGAVPLVAATIVGAPLTPFVAILALLVAMFGWLLGVYALGIGVWRRRGRPSPLTYRGRFGLACLGLLITGVVGLIPILGWMFCLAIALLGVGALTRSIARGRRFELA